jgi:hypothetical protein
MHQIKTSIRHIPADELPTTTPVDGEPRPMTDQELLNAGIQRITGDFYSCIHQEETDDDGNWQPKKGQVMPGTVLSEGTLVQRYANLSDDVKAQILQADVVNPESESPDVQRIAMADVTDDHVVQTSDVIPHSWAGEPR